jgi:arylsulfatase A-like enzyme
MNKPGKNLIKKSKGSNGIRGKRPNFLVIITEQHRGDCLGIEGHPVLQTPVMDNIAMRGVRFSQAYSSVPTCIAARRSFLSGQFPPTHGMVGYREGITWDAPSTVAGVLSGAGYQTEWIGRDHHQHPVRDRFGFDHMVINEDYREFLDKNQPPGSGGYFGGGIKNNDWTAKPWHMPEGLHQTNWTVNQALDFLDKRDPSCPFFLTISFSAAHPPLTPPSFYMERYIRTGVPAPVIGDWAELPPNNGTGLGPGSTRVDLDGESLISCRAGYYGLINHVDDQLNRLLNPVMGIDTMTGNNTVVIFISDHGEMLGDHYLFHKRVPYQGSARIPFLIRGPEYLDIRQGTVLDKPAAIADIMPTVLDMAGIDCPETVEGRSLLPMMQGKKEEWRGYLHLEHAPIHQSLTDGKEKYIWFTGDGREQFFDIENDPMECRDLINDRKRQKRISYWRKLLIDELKERPEGFTDGRKLIPGKPYPAVLPHAMKRPEKKAI